MVGWLCPDRKGATILYSPTHDEIAAKEQIAREQPVPSVFSDAELKTWHRRVGRMSYQQAEALSRAYEGGSFSEDSGSDATDCTAGCPAKSRSVQRNMSADRFKLRPNGYHCWLAGNHPLAAFAAQARHGGVLAGLLQAGRHRHADHAADRRAGNLVDASGMMLHVLSIHG